MRPSPSIEMPLRGDETDLDVVACKLTQSDQGLDARDAASCQENAEAHALFSIPSESGVGLAHARQGVSRSRRSMSEPAAARAAVAARPTTIRCHQETP